MEDFELIQKIQVGDLKAYELLMDRWMNYLYTIVNHTGGKRLQEEDKEEIIADVWIKLWNKRCDLEIQQGKEKVYLGRMARNTTLNVLRKKGLFESIALEEDCLEEITVEVGVEEQVLVREEQAIIQEVVFTLPEPDREIFIRRYFYFERVVEIAEVLGLNKRTIATKLFRGKQKLQKRLRERGIQG